MKLAMLTFAIAGFSASLQGQLTITNTSPLRPGTVGQNYSTTIIAQGGTLPYHYGESGNFPPWSNLYDLPRIDGTPTTATTYQFTITVTDVVYQTASKQFTLVINPPPAPAVTTLAATSITTTSATLNSQVNPNGASTTIYFQYGATTSYGSTTSQEGIGTASGDYFLTASSLTPNTPYHFRAVASSSGGTTYGGDMTFTTLPQPAPTVTTLPATSITSSSATLCSTVNPNGASTTMYFEYGPTTSYGTTTFSLSDITTSGNYNIGVATLSANKLYHYQAVAYNSGGTSYGGDQTFWTSTSQQQAPSVTTLAASSVSSSSATLNSQVNPNGASTTLYFQYGATTNYGSTTSHDAIGTAAGNYSLPASGLTPNILYHFQAVAYNSGGTSYGGDLTFTTLSSGPAPTNNFWLTTPCINGLQIWLNGATDPGSLVTNIVWDWGDGQEVTGGFPSAHNYSSAGQFVLKVTAYNSDGSNDSISQTNTVGPGVLSGCSTFTISAAQGGYVSYQTTVGSGTVSPGGTTTLYEAWPGGGELTANPSPGYSFSYWSASPGVWLNYGSTNTASVGAVGDDNSTITANFSPVILGPWTQALFVADFNGDIIEIMPGGVQFTFASGLAPCGLAFNSAGDLFEAECSSGNIYKFTPDGARSTFASGLSSPSALAFNSVGDLFVADCLSHSVYKFTPDGGQSTFASGLGCPQGVAFNSAGDLFVADGSPNIYKFTPGGTQSTFASGLDYPTALAFDSMGDLFVADNFTSSGNDYIYEFTPTGLRSTFASWDGIPIALAFDSAGDLFVADSLGSGNIYVFTPDGVQSTFASGWQVGALAFQPPPQPTVTTAPATAITSSSATLNGSVNPNGSATTAYFQWDTTTSYGHSVPSPPFSVGSGSNSLNVSAQNLGGLSPGTTYYFRLAANNRAGTAYGADQSFITRSNTTPISTVTPTLSTLTVAPSSAPADGSSQIIATATLRDGNNNPVAGKAVRFYASEVNAGGATVVGSLSVKAVVNPTGANGQATAVITANTPGTASIWAVDTTDSVVVQQQAAIQFTNTTLPLPNAQLQSAIKSLYEGTAQLLNGAPITGMNLATIATDEGHLGPTFWTLAEGAGLDALVGALFQAASEVIGGAEEELFVVGAAEETVKRILGSFLFSTALNLSEVGVDQVIAASVQEDKSSSGGVLVRRGQNVANTCASDQSSLVTQEQGLLAGVPPSANAISGALSADFTARLRANQVMQQYNTQMYGYFAAVANAAQAPASAQGLPTTILETTAITGGSTLFTALSDAARTPDPGVDSFQFLAQELQDYNNENNYLAENYAVGNAILSVASSASQMMSNINSAFTEILQSTGNPPALPICTIQGASACFVTGTTSLSSPTAPGTWAGDQTVTSVTVPTFNDVVSDMTIKNSGTSDATFMTYAFFTSSIEGLDAIGPVPQVCVATTQIAAGGSASVPIDYFPDNNGGEVLTISPISIQVLAFNASGVFWVGSTTLTVSGSCPSTQIKPLDLSTNVFPIGNPIRSYVSPNMSNQTYQAQIWVENHFVIPLSATVTQSLPSGAAVLATDGLSRGLSIVWSNSVAPSNAVVHNFVFTLPAIPGGLTNLPAAGVTFSDTNGNTLTLQGTAPTFDGLLPVQVSSSIPVGVLGVDSTMVLTVTNFTGTSQTGLLTATLADSSGTVVTNLSEWFSLDGLGDTNLDFTLPGSLPAGSYLLTGSLSINGGTGQVLAGTYVLPATPVRLSLASASPLTANGFSISLSGPGGSYLVEASTDISSPSNWQPILFYSTTNSTFYFNFTDPAATNYSCRFYRAILSP